MWCTSLKRDSPSESICIYIDIWRLRTSDTSDKKMVAIVDHFEKRRKGRNGMHKLKVYLYLLSCNMSSN